MGRGKARTGGGAGGAGRAGKTGGSGDAGKAVKAGEQVPGLSWPYKQIDCLRN